MPIDFKKLAEDKKSSHDAETKRQEAILTEQRAAHEKRMQEAITFLKERVYQHLEDARTSLSSLGIGLKITESFDRGYYENFVSPRVTISTTPPPRKSDGYVATTGSMAIESDGKKLSFFLSQDSYGDPKIPKGSSSDQDVAPMIERCFSEMLDLHYKTMQNSPHLQ